MKYLLLIALLIGCNDGQEEKKPEEPKTPIPVVTPGEPPKEVAIDFPKKTIKSFQIFHFKGLNNFKDKLKDGAELVTLELDQMAEAGKGVADYAHSKGTKVICYMSIGYEDWRADAKQYPKDAMGKEMDDWDGERWGDPRKESLLAFQGKRMDLCKSLGGDAIELDNIDAYSNQKESGIKISKQEAVLALNKYADLAHLKGLAIVAKNAPEIAPELAKTFQGLYVEECSRYSECDSYKAFAGKPVAMVEYGWICKKLDWSACQVKSGYFK